MLVHINSDRFATIIYGNVPVHNGMPNHNLFCLELGQGLIYLCHTSPWCHKISPVPKRPILPKNRPHRNRQFFLSHPIIRTGDIIKLLQRQIQFQYLWRYHHTQINNLRPSQPHFWCAAICPVPYLHQTTGYNPTLSFLQSACTSGQHT